MSYEKYITNVCARCSVSSNVALSDVIRKKSPENGIPNYWKYVGDFVDYQPYFLLCNKCVDEWNKHIQNEIEKFVKLTK